MTSLCIEEIQPILDLLDGYRVLIRPVLENKLLEVQECPLVRDFLAYLHDGLPGVLCGEFRAVRTLSMQNDIFNLEYLLKNS